MHSNDVLILLSVRDDKMARKLDILAEFQVWHEHCTLFRENVKKRKLFNLGLTTNPQIIGD